MNLKDKNCIITGASSGIGKEMALEMAVMGARLILTGRDKKKGDHALKEIIEKSNNRNIKMLYADFSDQKQIRSLAETIKSELDSIDVLMNNVGAFYPSRMLSPDGLEMTFAVNHIGYFLFTSLLMDLVIKDAPGKIINTSSAAHHSAKPDIEDLNLEKSYHGWTAYSNSKLYNLFFTYELDRKYRDKGIRVNAFHPGVIATDIVRNVFFPVPQLWKLFGKSVKAGAVGGVYLASSAEAENISGKYFKGRIEKKSSSLSLDRNLAGKLWEYSEKVCKLK